VKLRADKNTSLEGLIVYIRLISKLNLLTNIRADIPFSIQHLSQFLQHPRELEMNVAMYVLQCLKGEHALGILLNKKPTFDLLAFYNTNFLMSS